MRIFNVVWLSDVQNLILIICITFLWTYQVVLVWLVDLGEIPLALFWTNYWVKVFVVDEIHSQLVPHLINIGLVFIRNKFKRWWELVVIWFINVLQILLFGGFGLRLDHLRECHPFISSFDLIKVKRYFHGLFYLIFSGGWWISLKIISKRRLSIRVDVNELIFEVCFLIQLTGVSNEHRNGLVGYQSLIHRLADQSLLIFMVCWIGALVGRWRGNNSGENRRLLRCLYFVLEVCRKWRELCASCVQKVVLSLVAGLNS